MENKEYKFTEYFEKEVLRKRSYTKKEWCIKIIRVVTLADKKTIHNAFPDRRFKNEN